MISIIPHIKQGQVWIAFFGEFTPSPFWFSCNTTFQFLGACTSSAKKLVQHA
jgi:hypothetical protein